MEQSMREQLQALVDRWHERGIPSILWVLEELKRILATEPPAVSVKAGWVCKDRHGFWWDHRNPELFADGVWYTSEDVCVAGCITDPWPDKPNGGPECLMQVR